MKKLLFLVVALLLSFNLALASSIENEIREFAKREYPNDSRMQQYTYNKQVAAYNYLLTVKDSEVKEFASREYPNDYAMQKYTYDKQLAAKRYMQTVGDIEIKKFSIREYPYLKFPIKALRRHLQQHGYNRIYHGFAWSRA